MYNNNTSASFKPTTTTILTYGDVHSIPGHTVQDVDSTKTKQKHVKTPK
jgi:hypothetical protein